ncbi:hypothetical protein [Wohlfahrtiimonas populi]|uniref:hypothetical protein n=1 Tax=Wohlfahrtiimonas populi TaxID=1940240 RepID=UPI001181428B|nr:hypothetical protein [Wohlfahrtiimonas populi]
MKKSLICASLIIFGLTSFSVAEEQVELLPEVKELITPKPLDANLLENNRFIALLGATYAKDDYYNVTKTAFAKDYAAIFEALPEADMLSSEEISQIALELKKLDYLQGLLQWEDSANFVRTNPLCFEYNDANCIEKTIQNQSNIQQLLKNNDALIQRYDDIFSHYPVAHTLFFPREGYIVMPLPAYNYLLNILKMQLANSVILISGGKADQGIEVLSLLQRRINQMVYLEQKSNLIDVMIAGAMQQIMDQYLDALLNSKYSEQLLHHPEFLALMILGQDYTKHIHQATLLALKHESGLAFVLFEPILAIGDLSIAELNDYYLKKSQMEALYQSNPYDSATQKLVNKLCHDVTNNLLVMDCRHPMWQSGYLERNDTQRNYHNMVYLKYLMMKNQIQEKDIAEFLKSQGDLAIDPITQKPFIWNPDERSISLSGVQYKHLPAPIRRTMNDDAEPKILQVKLP